MTEDTITELQSGFNTAFVNSVFNSNLAYRPQFIYNNNKNGQKVFSAIEDELLRCDSFAISVTPHVCRHTFCSNMAKSGTNPKKLQYIMGHSDIGVTLNTYTHLGIDDVKDEIVQLDNCCGIFNTFRELIRRKRWEI